VQIWTHYPPESGFNESFVAHRVTRKIYRVRASRNDATAGLEPKTSCIQSHHPGLLCQSRLTFSGSSYSRRCGKCARFPCSCPSWSARDRARDGETETQRDKDKAREWVLKPVNADVGRQGPLLNRTRSLFVNVALEVVTLPPDIQGAEVIVAFFLNEWRFPESKAKTLIRSPNPVGPWSFSLQSSTLNAQPSTFNPQPATRNPQPSTLNPQPSTLNPQPSTINPQPSTLNPQPSTLNPQPQV